MDWRTAARSGRNRRLQNDHRSILRGVRRLVSVLRVVAGVLLVASIGVNFANVVGRYFFNSSIYWAEEVMLFLMVGCVFLGNGVVAWSGRQLRMDVIVGMMPAQAQKVLALLSELIFIVVAIAIVVFSWPVIRDLWNFDQRSQSAEIPMVIPQSMVPIGLSIMALLVVVRLLTGGDRSRRPARHRDIDGAPMISGRRLFRPSRDPAHSRAADLSRAAGDVPGRGAVRRRRADGGGADLSVRRPRQLCRCWRCRSSCWPARSWRRAASRAAWWSG